MRSGSPTTCSLPGPRSTAEGRRGVCVCGIACVGGNGWSDACFCRLRSWDKSLGPACRPRCGSRVQNGLRPHTAGSLTALARWRTVGAWRAPMLAARRRAEHAQSEYLLPRNQPQRPLSPSHLARRARRAPASVHEAQAGVNSSLASFRGWSGRAGEPRGVAQRASPQCGRFGGQPTRATWPCWSA